MQEEIIKFSEGFSMQSPRFKLYYWPISFRGCFISYILSYFESPFVEISNFDEINSLKELPLNQQPIPFVGPPILNDLIKNKTLSQMPAIIAYLSLELEDVPKDHFQKAIETKIIMDCNDILMEISRYNGSMMWNIEAWREFRSIRLPYWMKLFEEMIHRKHLGQSSISISDLCTFALFGNMIRCLPQLQEDLLKHAPKVFHLCEKMMSIPQLSRYITNQEKKYKKRYCGGYIEESIKKMLTLDEQKISTS
jgi:glutathione S-transferase